MAYVLHNMTGTTVWATLAIYVPDSATSTCQADFTVPWRKIGWYQVPPRQSITPDVLNGALPTFNRNIGIAAVSATQTFQGSSTGGEGLFVPSYEAFNQCLYDNNGGDELLQFQSISFDGVHLNETTYIGAGTAPGSQNENNIFFTYPNDGEIWIYQGSIAVEGWGFTPNSMVNADWSFDGPAGATGVNSNRFQTNPFGAFSGYLYFDSTISIDGGTAEVRFTDTAFPDLLTFLLTTFNPSPDP